MITRIILLVVLLLVVGCSDPECCSPEPEDNADIIFNSEVHSPDDHPIEQNMEVQQKGGIR